jgi:uncharacterized protein with HEPN domain
MSEREVHAFLQDMFEATRRILSYTKGLDYTAFQQDFKTQDAVLRNLEILGEAAKHIPAEVSTQYPNLPWREMAGTRDRLIHHYFGVNLDVVWGIVQMELPDVVTELEVLLENIDFRE